MTVGIVGLGLIGGSFAKAVKTKTTCKVLGLDTNETAQQCALQDGAIDAVLTNPADCDLLVVALFPGAAVESILQNVKLMKPGSIVMDLCGVKKAITDQVAQACKSFGVEFVGGHPMAGKECWGYNDSTANLFCGASMILTPIFTDSWALDKVQELCKQIGFGRIVFTDPNSHDKMIGYTSQLAHILSSAYVKNPLCMNYKGYTGGSFQDLTRVAKLNPPMWSELFLLNQGNLLADLDSLIGSLQEYRSAIEQADAELLIKLLADGSRIKENLSAESEGAQ